MPDINESMAKIEAHERECTIRYENIERLRPPQSFVMKPEVGKLLVFPSWLQHMVYPFKGEGERRTVASNLNCWNVPDVADQLKESWEVPEESLTTEKENVRNN